MRYISTSTNSKLDIDGEIYSVRQVHPIGRQPVLAEVTTDGGTFILAADSEEAGAAVADYYRDMQRNDKRQFRALIGEERLIQWACGESDSYGISSFDEFLEAVANEPAEHWASYDGNEWDCKPAPEWAGEADPDYFECAACEDLHPFTKDCLNPNADHSCGETFTREWIEENEPKAEILLWQEMAARLEWKAEDSDLINELGFTPTVAYRSN